MRTYLRMFALLPSAALAAAIGVAFCSMSHAQDFGPAHYLTDGTFALEPQPRPGRSTYAVVTFLPHHTLVFKDRNEIDRVIQGEPHESVITQNGLRLLVPKRLISTKSFKDVYGDQSIIFHEDESLCPEDDPDCGYGTEVSKGDVLQLLSSRGDNLKRLREVDRDGTTREGVITAQRFNRWEAMGILSDANLTFPRMYVTGITKLPSLTTPCGGKREQVDKGALTADIGASVEPNKAFGFVRLISDIFGLNLTLESKYEFERSKTLKAEYGKDGVQLEFSVVHLKVIDKLARDESDVGSDETWFVTAEILCLGEGVGAKPAVVNKVFVNAGDRVIASKSFDTFYSASLLGNPNHGLAPSGDNGQIVLGDNSPAFRVYIENGGLPYMTSITGAKSYERIFELWTNNGLLDYSRAAILMAMFNVSCPNRAVDGLNSLIDCGRTLGEPDF